MENIDIHSPPVTMSIFQQITLPYYTTCIFGMHFAAAVERLLLKGRCSNRELSCNMLQVTEKSQGSSVMGERASCALNGAFCKKGKKVRMAMR